MCSFDSRACVRARRRTRCPTSHEVPAALERTLRRSRRMLNRRITMQVLIVAAASLLVGCTQHLETSPIAAIPATALPVKEGSGRLFFQSVDPGTVYVFDADTVSLLFSAPIERGERFVLEPTQAHAATVEGRPVYDKPLPRHHMFRLYFEPRVGPTTSTTTTQEAP